MIKYYTRWHSLNVKHKKVRGNQENEEYITKLFNGEIYPAEQYRPKTEENRGLYRESYQKYNEFVEKLNSLDPDLNQKFIEILDSQFDVLPIEMSEMFIDGFKLGARLMIELYQDA